MEHTGWDLIKKLYEDNFDVNGHVIDYVAVNDILKFCVSGFSNEKISGLLKLDQAYVHKVIYNFLGFYGWEADLDLSPWRIFCRVNGSKFAFAKEIEVLTNLVNDDIIELAFRICSIYNSIRGEIEAFYERS